MTKRQEETKHQERYWDGRVRRVVSVRYLPPVCRADQPVRVETLDCGHEKYPVFPAGHVVTGNEQFRVCFACPRVKS